MSGLGSLSPTCEMGRGGGDGAGCEVIMLLDPCNMAGRWAGPVAQMGRGWSHVFFLLLLVVALGHIQLLPTGNLCYCSPV
jgi:hypothetical protein